MGLQALSQAYVAPSPESVEVARSYLRRIEQSELELIQSLDAELRAITPRGYDRSEALYFEVVSFVERMRALVSDKGISTGSSERYGFGQYIDAQQLILPDQENTPVARRAIEQIDLQLQLLERLLGHLFEAGPSSIRGVDRESVIPLNPESKSLPEDLFEVSPLVSAGVPESIFTMGFRFVFDGRTATLRDFLTAVVAEEMPVVIRSVEVSPVETEKPGKAGQLQETPRSRTTGSTSPSPFSVFGVSSASTRKIDDPEASAVARPVPIVESNESVFIVVIEYYEILGSTGRSEEGGVE